MSVGRCLVVVAGAVAGLLACGTPFASAAAVAVVLASDGGTLAQADSGAPYADATTGGWAVRIGATDALPSGTRLGDISLLGGRVYIARMFIPTHGLDGASIQGLVVDGKHLRARANELIPLGRDGYAVVLQEAVIPNLGSKGKGVVGLRVVIGPNSTGLLPGTQILVGLGGAASSTHPSRSAPPASAVLSMLTLGLDETSLSSAGLVPLADPLAGLPGNNAFGARAATIAMGYLGVPYVWGGASPLTGFDCSGLTMYVYAQLGIPLTHYTVSQFYEGTHVPRDQLQPGDLIFFDPGPGGPTHEGLYIGGGRFIQAPHTGDVVKISDLADPSYLTSYVGAARPHR